MYYQYNFEIRGTDHVVARPALAGLSYPERLEKK